MQTQGLLPRAQKLLCLEAQLVRVPTAHQSLEWVGITVTARAPLSPLPSGEAEAAKADNAP